MNEGLLPGLHRIQLAVSDLYATSFGSDFQRSNRIDGSKLRLMRRELRTTNAERASRGGSPFVAIAWCDQLPIEMFTE